MNLTFSSKGSNTKFAFVVCTQKSELELDKLPIM